MQVDLGKLVREQRTRRGWDQAQLARRLGDVGQQTVSRWERNQSRPRRNMVARLAKLFEMEAAELLTAAGYAQTADRPDEMPLPVRPRLTVLPVAELSPDRFEELVADVAQLLYPKSRASRFGNQGHKQYGVDVIAQDGSRTIATFQCKRHKKFGPKDVLDAVSAVGINAEAHFLVLTRTASPDCRAEMAAHERWTLWDVEDLSRVVRQRLPLDDAVRLVDTYFPGWREPLLGVAEPGPWLGVADFFRSLGSSQVYSHDWRLVGRAKELDEIMGFLSDPVGPVGCLIGRGGIGKSRLLREIATLAEARSFKVRFLTTDADLKPAHFELLPTDRPLLVILDDAHDRQDIALTIRNILRRHPEARVLLALRPYGLAALAGDLRELGVHPTESPRWKLDDLTQQDAEALARDALGPDWPEVIVRRLGRLTADCPLITVVGGVLIRRGQLDPACLDHEDTIRTEILRAFRDVLVADPVAGDPELRRAVLDAIAVLQPFRSDDPAFRTTLTTLVDAPFDRALTHIKGLEDAGVLLRRGRSLRIVPDLLGDVILAEACFDERSGASTGFVERTCEAADGEPLQHVFVNATRVDWQVHHDHKAPPLAAALWEAVETELRAAGILGRRHVLQLLQKVAHFEPARTLRVARWITDHPTNDVEEVGDLEGAFLKLHPPTYADVLHELPPLLRSVAYNLEHLPAAMDLLWDLAQADARPVNQNPDHAIRVLRDLAEFGIGKPLAYNHAVIDAAERWLGHGEAGDFAHSPFDVLEPMLATEGMDDSANGFQIVLKPFALDPSSVAPLRERIIDLAFREISSGDLRLSVRAVQAFEAGLRYPVGLVGREVSDTERDYWTPGFIAIIDRLGSVARQVVLDPVIVVALRRALHWHTDFSPTSTQAAAQQVLDALPSEPEQELALALFDGWGRLSRDRSEDYAQAEANEAARLQALAQALVDAHSDEQLADLLSCRLEAQTAAFGPTGGSPGRVVWTLIAIRPSLGVEIMARVAADATSILATVVAVTLAALVEHRPDNAMSAVRALLRTGEISMRQHVAQGLGWNRGPRTSLAEGEFDILVGLAADHDPYVRTCVIQAARRLALNHPTEALMLISEVPFADSGTVADEVFETLDKRGQLSWRQLPEQQASTMLRQLEQCPSIEGHDITSFLAELSMDQPAVVVRLLQSRVERWEQVESGSDFRALPSQWGQPLRVREHSDFLLLLRQIRDWIASDPDSWLRRHGGSELFAAVAGPFDEAVLSVLEEVASTGDANQMTAVAAILHQAPVRMVYENVDFVRRILAAASKVSEEHVKRIGGALSAAASAGVRMGTPGQPFTEDLHQRDLAREIADRLPTGTNEERLYRSQHVSAEDNIKWHADRDGQFFDGRDW